MFCPKCGKERNGEGKFCGGCGYRFEEKITNHEESSEKDNISCREHSQDIRKPKTIENKKESNVKAKKSSNKSVLIAIASAFIVVALLIGAMFSMMGGYKNSNNGNDIIANSKVNDVNDTKKDDIKDVNDKENDSQSNNSVSDNPDDIEDNSNPEDDNSNKGDILSISKYYEPRSIDASSYLDATDSSHYFPENVDDQNKETAWVEAAEGNGSGEWIRLNFDGEVTIDGIEFHNGYKKSKETYLKNNRPFNVLLEFSDGSHMNVQFSDTFEYTSILPVDSVTTSFVKLTIVDVYKGSTYDDTCISEIRAFKE